MRQKLAWVSGFLCTLICGERVEAQLSPISDVNKAWQARQERVRSARFRWIEHRTVARGSLTKLLAPLPFAADRLQSMGIHPDEVVPPEDTTFEVTASLSLEGNKLRYERHDKQWSGKAKMYVTQPYLTVFDGKLGTSFQAEGSPYAPWPQAVIRRGHPDAGARALSPLIASFRGCLTQMTIFPIETLEFRGQQRDVEGRPSLQFQQRLGHFLRHVWIDPSLDYSIVSWLDSVKGRPRVKGDVKYRRDVKGEWTPTTWEIMLLYQDGEFEESTRAELTRVEINGKPQQAEFAVEFPAGTRVSDQSNPREPKEYIVRTNGAKRMILPHEIGATYERMLKTESGQALGQAAPTSRLPLISIAGLIGAAALLILLWRHRHLLSRLVS